MSDQGVGGAAPAGAGDEALRRSEERYRALVEATTQAVWSWSPETGAGEFERTQRWWEEVTGQTPEEQRGSQTAWLDVVHPDDRAAAGTAWTTSRATGAPYDVEYRVRARDGGWRHVHARGVPIPGPGGTPREWVGTLDDVTERRRAERDNARLLLEVEAERRRLAEVFQHAPSFMCVLRGPDHVFERANDRYLELVGRRDVIGRTVAEALPEAAEQGFIEILDRVYRTGEPHVGSAARIALAREGGIDERFLDFVYQPLRDAAGTVSGVLVQGIDLTERVRAEQELVRVTAESERQRRMFDTILSSAPDFVYLFDLSGRFTYVNKALLDLWQKPLSAALGRNFFELDYPPDLAARLQQQIRDVIATRRPVRDETPYTSAAGTRAYEYIFVPVFGADGEVEAVAGSTRDISDRKRAEEALRQSEAEFRETFERAGVGKAQADPRTGRLVRVNPKLCEFLGYTADELLGMTIRDLTHPDDREAGDARFRSLVEGAVDQYAVEKRYLRKGGEPVWVRVTATVVRTPDGRPVRASAIIEDVTARTQAEAALKDADRKKDDFIALLAHELRNPLAPIRNGLQVLRLAEAKPIRDRAQEMMDRQLTHMVRLIDDLLDVSRITRNKMDLRREPVPLADVVNSAVEAARPAIDGAGHELTVSLPARPVVLDADPTRLSQVFSNLLGNSAKYTPRGGRIWLSAERTPTGVAVTVRDTGIGIPAAALPTIFDMFSQVDRSIERSTGGLGIGLALVKGLVEMHGGTVAAGSDGEGRGTAFVVTLPVPRDAPDPPPPADRGGPRSGPGRRILVVDDSRDGAESLAEMLRLLGNEVRTAGDGIEAVAAAERFAPDVILMDVGMPRMNGLDATRRIREQPWGRAACIIALTGWGQENDRLRSRDAGCDGHLVKPVAVADLQALLAELRR
ncbi:pas sensor signal transduction histidine kinase : PAS domain S-box protein OS=Massilia sp. LC238 GN=FG94_04812 PE=4 SV=1: PAS_3: PAS_4: PAS_4: PAS_9: HisKA: HATPase_c: Response_reg [Gemmataceae bacterium]|nr:pas sensor signal transduction histidine kinase : PAS domain S-box protein OS=Massilia sp. LC238 GN=FG94_04812 PE=4 SV=1: PAS_3: PAS_4: PAS_4: PAS_9: HisKA: HATPase_c: Response_reg [Gemmataceae bacterium]VTT96878.1 pas sensor signal transduction histidine kinase : PAS domain S-box protein OS=Massilia sp. LC238 GN=FG94_04812 PE=4 SV=1: PAS_3: PAS_4: PAS_4: PAS_9: HisKA: HATPase_c: Response_reg [Gemmataceae bacterium]